MRVSDIRDMQDNRAFMIFPEIGKVAVKHRRACFQTFLKYCELYCTSKRWGLPNGQGWANETILCMKVLMHFDELQDKIDAWRIEQS